MSKGSIYTYHLPYGTRRSICNLLDADQSWRTLGGHYLGLDATQLTLIGQAYLRNGSPTEELLNRMDSANLTISEFCFYLKHMNHHRALEILKPHVIINAPNGLPYQQGQQQQQQDSFMTTSSGANIRGHPEQGTTLCTPTPSFNDIQPAGGGGGGNINNALLADDNLGPYIPIEYHDQEPALMMSVSSSNHPGDQQAAGHETGAQQVPRPCHRSSGQQQQPEQQLAQQPNGNPADPATNKVAADPGEEIVRMACANNRKRTSISDQEVVNQLRLIMQINYNELKQASNGFSDTNILGNGGFASVYRGYWKGTDVAIKRLRCNLMDQALNELTILNSYRIDNILPIYGISIDGPEACLVYQFMANGSLEDRLSCKNDTRPLTWQQRALIGEGVAKGLYYLHTLRDKPLVHGDVKSANVLLDSQFVPKLGDFGLARQVFKGKNPQTELCTHCTVSSIHGTSVYLPPEYLRHKILSPAVDVYSYGIVMLEMATGKRAYDGKRLLIDLVEDETRSMAAGEIGYSLKDPRLLNDTQSDLRIWFELLIKLGLQCSHKIKKKRPDIGQVLNHFANYKHSSHQLLVEAAAAAAASESSSVMCVGAGGGGGPVGGVDQVSAASTARTLTPELTALDKTNRRQRQPKKAAAIINDNNNQGPHERHASTALMSFEEEEEQDEEAAGAAQGEAQHAAAAAKPARGAVEAMIPLLTELGIAAGTGEAS